MAGPNGAGKSTLIKILAGETSADAGDIELDGRPWDTGGDRDRVAVVHQEPQLFPNLTVGENVMVGREGTRGPGPRPGRAERVAACATWPSSTYADRTLEAVPLAIQQRVEIARALARDARVFLFDEPNSALTQEESNDLFRRMHALADAGKVVHPRLPPDRRARRAHRPRRGHPRRRVHGRPGGRGPDPGGHRRRPRDRPGRRASPDEQIVVAPRRRMRRPRSA